MDLSVIIVNYNVKYFLEQCLHSVYKSISGLNAEVFVVDNHSADGSAQMLKLKFPNVRLIENKQNVGFAVANNQAIRKATGRYILLLNPDTVIQENTFGSCIGFMDAHPDAGCLGVKMIDGQGNFLPESKRALPTPVVAFYKIFGLSALFPKSKRFGRYHLGYLNRDAINEVDVISGAFMFLRKEAIEKAGMLDEEFFMYGEDIDISFRLKLNGYKNYYFPETTIIHYKGESTKKGSINYVILFYRAMIIFARKHFSKNIAFIYSFLIHLAIYIRAGFSISQRFILGIINPLLDALVIFTGFALFLPVWEEYIFKYSGTYPPPYLHFVVPTYIVIWLLSVFFSAGYEKQVKASDIFRGIIAGTLIILVIYALLPLRFRFSRALILLGTIWALISTLSIRFLLSVISKDNFKLEWYKKRKRIIIVGGANEGRRVLSILEQTQIKPELIGFVSPDEESTDTRFIGHIGQIEDIVKINHADELIFCSSEMTAQSIIKTMLQFTDAGIEFKIAPEESLSVIGSNSINAGGDLYVVHFNTLSRKINKRKKRLLDIVLSIIFMPFFPVLILFVKYPVGFLKNIFKVLVGYASWVGYYQTIGGNHPGLPKLKTGILNPVDLMIINIGENDIPEKANLMYAKDYKIYNDMNIIFRCFGKLGRQPVIVQSSN